MASDGTDVVPDSVSAFGKKCLDEGHALIQASGSTMGDLSKAMPGKSMLSEGASFRGLHSLAVGGAQMLIRDVYTGLLALGNGGITIAQNYREADLSQAEQMASVDAAFNPAAGTPSLASMMAAEPAPKRPTGATRAGRAESAPDAGAAPVYGPPATPQEEVNLHNELYGENEQWRPEPAPDPEPRPYII